MKKEEIIKAIINDKGYITQCKKPNTYSGEVSISIELLYSNGRFKGKGVMSGTTFCYKMTESRLNSYLPEGYKWKYTYGQGMGNTLLTLTGIELGG